MARQNLSPTQTKQTLESLTAAAKKDILAEAQRIQGREGRNGEGLRLRQTTRTSKPSKEMAQISSKCPKH